jgi:hypothetical protein
LHHGEFLVYTFDVMVDARKKIPQIGELKQWLETQAV